MKRRKNHRAVSSKSALAAAISAANTAETAVAKAEAGRARAERLVLDKATELDSAEASLRSAADVDTERTVKALVAGKQAALGGAHRKAQGLAADRAVDRDVAGAALAAIERSLPSLREAVHFRKRDLTRAVSAVIKTGWRRELLDEAIALQIELAAKRVLLWQLVRHDAVGDDDGAAVLEFLRNRLIPGRPAVAATLQISDSEQTDWRQHPIAQKFTSMVDGLMHDAAAPLAVLGIAE